MFSLYVSDGLFAIWIFMFIVSIRHEEGCVCGNPVFISIKVWWKQQIPEKKELPAGAH